MTTQNRSKEDVLSEFPSKILAHNEWDEKKNHKTIRVQYFSQSDVLKSMDTYTSQFIQEIEYWKQRLSDCENMNQQQGREGKII